MAETHSRAVKKSWENPETAKSRSTKNHVTVTFEDGSELEYTSTYQAFLALGLPHQKCIAWRTSFKKIGAKTYHADDGKAYAFKVIPNIRRRK
jgi:hypothetical protein